MRRKEFIEELKEHLMGLPEEDKKEIIEDYEEHFKVGKKMKRKDSEIAEALGSPKKLAREIRKELKNKDNVDFESSMVELWVEVKTSFRNAFKAVEKEIPYIKKKVKTFFNNLGKTKQKTKSKQIKKEKRKVSGWKITLLLLLDLFVMIWLFPTILAVMISLFATGFSIIISGFTMIVSSLISMLIPTTYSVINLLFSLMFAGIGVLCLGILLSMLFWKIGKYFLKGVIKYLKFHGRIFTGRRQ